MIHTRTLFAVWGAVFGLIFRPILRWVNRVRYRNTPLRSRLLGLHVGNATLERRGKSRRSRRWP